MALNLIILDGADYNFIHENLDVLPCFKRLHNVYGVDLLMCDVFPSTVASTSTIFTGKEPEIKGFCEPDTGHMTTLENLKGPPLWETLKDKMNVKILLAYVMLPPVNIGFPTFNHPKPKRRTRIWLPASEEEIKLHTEYVLERTLKTLVEPGPKFFSATFHTLDTACHLFKSPGERDMFSPNHPFFDYYKQAHEWLNPILPLLEESDFMIISDHGLPAYHPVKIRGAARHDPHGICITNLEHKPRKISEVHQAILDN